MSGPPVPSLAKLRQWTREPHLELSPRAIGLLFGPTSTAGDVPAFLAETSVGSRAGLVHLWEAARYRHGPRPAHPVYARLSAMMWIEGKGRSALEEFGLSRNGFRPSDLLDAMLPFRCSAVLMSPAELEAFAALPDPFPVWRGGSEDAGALVVGHSWTTDREMAERFSELASRRTGRDAVVVSRVVPKASVLAYFVDRSEAEAVLYPVAADA